MRDPLHLPKLIRRDGKWAVEVDRGMVITWWLIDRTLYVMVDGENLEIGGVRYRDELEAEGLA